MEHIPIFTNSKQTTQLGFSLLELMIVITILGIIASFALPAFNDLIKNNCLTSKATDLVTSLHFARSESVKRRVAVVLRARDIATTAAPMNEWSDGWEISVEGGALIRRFELLSCSQTTMDEVINTPVDTTDNDTAYTYFPTGFIDFPGTIDICDDRTGERGRRVSINITGRPNLAQIVCP